MSLNSLGYSTKRERLEVGLSIEPNLCYRNAVKVGDLCIWVQTAGSSIIQTLGTGQNIFT